MQSEDNDTRIVALWLFKALVDQGQGFDEAIEAAKAGMQRDNIIQSGNGLISFIALGLFKALVNQGQGLVEAIEIAKADMQSENDWISFLALELFKELLAREYGFDAAIAAVNANINHDDCRARLVALKLLRELVARKYRPGCDIAMRTVAAAIGDEDPDVRRSAKKLSKMLLDISEER